MARWHDLFVATYNVGDGKNGPKYADLANFVDKGADAILGQEFGDRASLVALFLHHHSNWGALYVKRKNKTRESVIFYNRTTLRLGRLLQYLVHIGYLGPQGAGGDNPGIKAITTGVFRMRPARRRVRLLTTHAVVSAFSTHGAERLRRVAAYTRQMTKFFAIVRLSRVPTIGGGDMNATPSNRTLRRLLLGNWTWDGTGATRGHRDIDLLGHKANRNLRFIGTEIIETDGSQRYGDHRARLNHYQVRGR